MKILTRKIGDNYVIELSGELDMETSVRFRDELHSILKIRPQKVIIDLEGVVYMDSSGIATLIEGYKISCKNDIVFVLVGVKEKVKRVFELASLIDFFKIYESVDDALESKDSPC